MDKRIEAQAKRLINNLCATANELETALKSDNQQLVDDILASWDEEYINAINRN